MRLVIFAGDSVSPRLTFLYKVKVENTPAVFLHLVLLSLHVKIEGLGFWHPGLLFPVLPKPD